MARNRNRNQGSQDPQGSPPLHLRIELTEPEKAEGKDEWILEAIATVGRGESSLPNQPVQFFLDGQEVDGPVLTDGNGRAKKKFSAIPKGTHSWEAQIQRTSIKSRESKTLKGEEKKTPKPEHVSISVLNHAPNKYRITARVTTTEKVGIKGLKVSMYDPETNQAQNPETDDRGVVQGEFITNGAEKSIEVSVPGTTETEYVTLYPQRTN